jgi:hypothetical protein
VGVNSPNVPFVLQHPSSSIDLSFSLTGWALDYRNTIDPFVSRNRDLPAFELSNMDWESVQLVTSWLKSFKAAMMEMSATKVSMLSTTHAIFRGLQDNIKTILHDLSDSVSLNIKMGLTDAHCKLSDYYYQYNASLTEVDRYAITLQCAQTT